MASSGQSSELQSLIALIKTLTNAQMKEILRSEFLPVSGVKAALQLRIIDYVERLYQDGQMERYENFKNFICSFSNRSLPPSPATTRQYQSQYTSSRPSQVKESVGSTMSSHPFSNGRLTFKESPFYTILEPLSPTVECKVREQTRDSVDMKFTLNPTTASRLQTDPNLRVMVYCAADTGLNQFSKSDIAFPHQVELRANLDEVKANLRGLKNKPGTTRPADITNYVRKRAGYVNQVTMTFALTQKKFYVVVNLVQRRPVEDLVGQLKDRKIISKEQVLREMQSRADDADIVATSTVMSLKCPLSTLRIQVPCRSMICTHHQCFDASSFLQLQEQAPTWTCPVCNKSTSFESLQVDQYVDEILKSTPSDVEQVTIEPDGTWHQNKADDSSQSNNIPASTADGDDDFYEIEQLYTPNVKREDAPESVDLHTTTPSTQTRIPSVPKSSQKRPAPQVIDLTLSDDEDETPPRPAKRQALGTGDNPSSQPLQNGTNGYTENANLAFSSGTESLSPGQSTFYIDL